MGAFAGIITRLPEGTDSRVFHLFGWPEFIYDLGVTGRVVGILAAGAVFDAVMVDIISAAGFSLRIQGAEAEQTVEDLRLACFMAGEILAVPVLKEGASH